MHIFRQKLLLPFFMSFILLALIVGPVFAQFSLNVVIQSVQVTTLQSEAKYQVDIYTSVLEENGNPIKNLDKSDFTVMQDSNPVVLDTVEPATNIPIQVIMVFDTSGSMAGTPEAQSIAAANNFVSNLNTNDQVAVFSFNNSVTKVTDFTDSNSARQAISSIQAIPGAGTCLYDALYTSAELAQSLAPGRRAILVLTDGQDETPSGSLCSSHTVDDVVAKAAQGTTRVPIYTIGLGKDVDQNVLNRLSGLSGGFSLYATSPTELENLFEEVTQQLKYQYHLAYKAQGASGQHTITVQASIGSNRDVKSVDTFFPAMPPVINITSPTENSAISGKTSVQVSLGGNIASVGSIELEINGNKVANATTAPYTLQFDSSSYPAGNLELDVVALDSSGTEISRQKVDVTVSSQPNQTTTGTVSSITQKVSGIPLPVLIAGGAIIVFAIVVGILVVSRKKKKSKKDVAAESSSEGATIDGLYIPGPVGSAQVFLLVENSDDVMRKGEKIPLTKFPVTLGRSKENMIVFEKDQPVSRYHAVIEYNNDNFTLSEVMHAQPDGSKKYPTYGTYINEMRLSGNSVSLSANDEIRLGTRLKLRFIKPSSEESHENLNEGETMDGFPTGENIPGDTNTQ